MTAAPSRRRWLRWALLALALLILLPVAGAAALLLTFDANAWKPRIEAAVQAATGRGFAIAGPIGTKLSLRPTITLEGVSLDNPPGFSRPHMAEFRRAEVTFAVLPLLSRRVEIADLALDGADVLLERDAAGRPNWVFGQPARPGAPAAPPTPAGTPTRPYGIAVERVLLADSLLGLRDTPSVPARTLAVRRLEAKATGPQHGFRLDGSLAWQDHPFTLEGETGALGALLAGTLEAWPLRLALRDETGLGFTAEGTLSPAGAYRLGVTFAAADLAALAPLLPDQPLPPLRGVEAAATLAGQGGLPAVSDLRLAIGASDLNVLYPGLALDRATLALPAPDQPLAVEAAGHVGTVPVTLTGTLGAPLRLMAPGPAAPWPVSLRGTAASATLEVSGAIADPRAGTGIDLAVAGKAPDLAALAPLLPAVLPLPALRDLAFDLHLAEQGPFFAQGAVLRDLHAASSAGDVGGTLRLATRPRQAISGQLTSTRLDVDALQPVARPAAPAAAPTTTPAPQPAPHAETANAAPDRRVIPDLPLPLDLLRLADGDLQFAAQSLRLRGQDWREVSGHLVMQGGKARLDPLAATLDRAGRVTLRAAADITSEPPTVQLALHGEGLDLAAIPAAGISSGKIGVDLDLRGRGRALRAVAASAYGHLGVTLQGGRISPERLGDLLAGLRQRVPGLDDIASRPLELGCAAARLAVEDGIARPQVLLAESSLGRLGAGEGAGTISLRDERLALRVNADLRLPVPGLPQGLRIRAPVPVTGTLAAPRLEWNAAAGAALQGEVADRAGRALGREAGQFLSALGGALAGHAEAAPGPIPACDAALAVAHGQPAPVSAPASPAPSPAASPAPAPAAAAPHRDPAQELLRRLPLKGLFGR